jgi:trimeric autotransporter adhesin
MLRSEGLRLTTTGVGAAALLAAQVVTVLMLVGLISSPARAATPFTVNRTGDAHDMKFNGVCDALRMRGKQCTLRAAIEEANDTSGADTINFNIGGAASVKTITPASALPTIMDPVSIDGYTQPGAHANTLAEGDNAVLKIELSGANAGRNDSGLGVAAADSMIKGLVINRFGTGIRVTGSGAIGNTIEGNFIGTDPSGTQRLRNGYGVRIGGGSANNTVGGTNPEARNVISGNLGHGVSILASGNLVQGNYIGTDKRGASAMGNFDGVSIAGPNNIIGGTTEEARNVISGNRHYGVHLIYVKRGLLAVDNKIEGNFIGTDASGTVDVGNSVGVHISSRNNTVGGTVSGAGNVISGNDFDGMSIISGADGTKVEGNTIQNNGGSGVVMSLPPQATPSDITIGGMAPEAGNQIFNNGGNGVRIWFGLGIRILSNQIYGNAELGIKLGDVTTGTGVTTNDEDDPDTGPNNRQNFPEIISAIRGPTTGVTTISGTLNSNPSQNFTIQCFATEAGGDPSGHGEGQTLLDTTTTTTGTDGNSPTFTCTSNTPAVGDKVTMTATNTATGDTSEFSLNVQDTSST